ncbi:GFA family protein [Falsihalocynthiibacter sp. SS001]|uniref:GFA family protein n=1 Tax=Falsihalocynthiibacter sp. SS001 TaxID=3349698 RepID=UPI0036D382B3
MKGSCLCGEVAFEIEGALNPPVACHCSQCRKTSGHYWCAAQAVESGLKLTKSSTLTWFRSSDYAKRGFCNACGSSLFWKMDTETTISVAMGALEPPTDMKIRAHIFVADKGDYYEIEDGPEQLAKY